MTNELCPHCQLPRQGAHDCFRSMRGEIERLQTALRGFLPANHPAAQSVEPSADARDAARYRYIRQGEDALSPEDEQPYADMWKTIWLKGCDREKMDAVVDAAMASMHDTGDQP